MGPTSDSEDDIPLGIPNFARAWSNSVRRPARPPDPRTYHEVIEPQAIFELDEEQKDGSLKTVFVVPLRCEYCAGIAQACSRTRPACARCRKRGRPCKTSLSRYDILPGPKQSKLRKSKATSREESTLVELQPNGNDLEPSQSQSLLPEPTPLNEASSGRSKRSGGGKKVTTNTSSSSKRPSSPEATAVVPSKKRRSKKEVSKERTSPQAPEPATTTGTEDVSGRQNPEAKWSFVKISDKGGGGSVAHDGSTLSARSSAGTPRAWTNSRDELFRVFPELAGPSGLSWLQSETPVLVLDRCRPEDMWTGPTTLMFTMMWDFSCDLSALESSDSPGVSGCMGSTDHHAHVHPTQDVESRSAVTPIAVETNPEGASRSAELGVVAAAVSSQPIVANHGFCHALDAEMGTILNHQTSDDGPSSSPQQDIHDTQHSSSVPPLPSPKATIPGVKPEEIYTLSDSHAYLVPVLIWSSRECRLTPGTPSPEYAYSCLGFFFISDLREDVVDYTVNTATQTVCGRVRWYVDLEWAPGGEEFLSSEMDNSLPDMDGHVQLTREDLARPWWLDRSDEAIEVLPCYRPRDLRMHYYSYLPLDLLADFHPSENFPRGWFCTRCGMINAQQLFRHQICQSPTCKLTSDDCSRRGMADPLSKLRSPHHAQKLVYPINNAPPFLEYEQGSWDDRMQYWTYLVKDDVLVHHVFTGNEDFLQIEATELLEDIQRDVLLRREDLSSPYFTHVTTISHSIDPPVTEVPRDTPSCVRTAYKCMLHCAERYGGIDNPSFNRVSIQAWTSTGSKRGKVFHAKTSPVIIMCLGAEVVLNVVPKAGYENPSTTTVADTVVNADEGEDVHPTEISPECPKEVTSTPSTIQPEQIAGPSHQNGDVATTAAEINQPSYQKGGGTDPDVESRPDIVSPTPPPHNGTEISASVEKSASTSNGGRGRKKGNAKQKRKRSDPEISITLVHGDSAILKGDDFECQIVRTGTTILVIGSAEAS